MHRWPPLQRRRNEICWRIVTSMLPNCSEMFILGTNWKTRYSMVREQTCKIHDKMDQSLWQTPESIDFLYSSYIWIQTIYCHVGNTAKQCRLGLFQDSDFAGDLEVSKSTSGGTLCVFGSHTFVPISWMCKKQTAVSHSLTKSEMISLDTGLRLDGLPALELWDLIVSVFWKRDSDFRQNGVTCWYWKKSIISWEDQRTQEYRKCSLERPVFAPRSFVVCVWRQWSSDEDDHQREESYNETCFQDSQSCSWLVVWSN